MMRSSWSGNRKLSPIVSTQSFRERRQAQEQVQAIVRDTIRQDAESLAAEQEDKELKEREKQTKKRKSLNITKKKTSGTLDAVHAASSELAKHAQRRVTNAVRNTVMYLQESVEQATTVQVGGRECKGSSVVSNGTPESYGRRLWLGNWDVVPNMRCSALPSCTLLECCNAISPSDPSPTPYVITSAPPGRRLR